MNINCYIYISDTVHLNITENPLSSLNLSTTTPDDKRSIKLTMNPLENLVNKLSFNISVEKATMSVLLIVKGWSLKEEGNLVTGKSTQFVRARTPWIFYPGHSNFSSPAEASLSLRFYLHLMS